MSKNYYTQNFSRRDLEAYFERASKFNIRYRKGIFRDRIGKAVFLSQWHEDGWNKKELRFFTAQGWAMPMNLRDPRTGSLRAGVVLLTTLEPQMTPFKQVLSGDFISARRWIRRFMRPFRGMPRKLTVAQRPSASWRHIVIFGLALLIALLYAVKCLAFSRGPVQPQRIIKDLDGGTRILRFSGSIPEGEMGVFEITDKSVICVWVRGFHETALSCVHQ